jgi:hypothetical protein
LGKRFALRTLVPRIHPKSVAMEQLPDPIQPRFHPGLLLRVDRPGVQGIPPDMSPAEGQQQPVQPQLGQDCPVIVHDYPASQAALARMRPGPPPVAERFELYVDGIELANGYHELLDPDVLRRRNRQSNAHRQSDGKAPLPEESRC